MGLSHAIKDGIAELVMSYPPVNALDVKGWFDLAHLVRRLGDDPEVRVIILSAEGRGFNAGVDIKEIQRTQGFDALIGVNRGMSPVPTVSPSRRSSTVPAWRSVRVKAASRRCGPGGTTVAATA